MAVQGPYLLFLGDTVERTLAKTACGVIDWAPDRCLGQLRLSEDTVSLGLPDLTPQAAAAAGARTLVVGIANVGGRWDERWRDVFRVALESGLDIAAGMHERLNADPELSSIAMAQGRRLIDLRDPPSDLPIGNGKPRSGRRILTVGTDCAVGKKYAALSIWQALQDLGADASFCATGQTGVLISGRGFAIDSVVADFISGAAERLSPSADPSHIDVIEGQGSLFHPAYAGVSLGLLHGAQPEAIILCHEPGRDEIAHFEGYALPSLDEAITRHLEMGRLTSPSLYCAGISLNTSKLDEASADRVLRETAQSLELPVIDPMRTGGRAIAEAFVEKTAS